MSLQVNTNWFQVNSPESWTTNTASCESILGLSKTLSLPSSTSSNHNPLSPTPSPVVGRPPSTKPFNSISPLPRDLSWYQLPTNSPQLDWDVYIENTQIGAGPRLTSNDTILPPSIPSTGFIDLQTNSTPWEPSMTGGCIVPTVPTPNSTLKTFEETDRIPQRNIDIEAELSRQNLYKTELCRSWVESACCKYGNKCQFAHGQHELRPVIRHPKYKTEICKTFHTNGTCPYGKRCRFVHNPAELRMPDELGLDGLEQEIDEEQKELEQKMSQLRLGLLAPDPVFCPPQEQSGVTTSTPTKKGSRLPFFQKLRKH